MPMVIPAPPLEGRLYALFSSVGPRPLGVANALIFPEPSTRARAKQRANPCGTAPQSSLCCSCGIDDSGSSVDEEVDSSPPPDEQLAVAMIGRASANTHAQRLERIDVDIADS